MSGTLLGVWDPAIKDIRFLPSWDLHPRGVERARTIGRRNHTGGSGRRILGVQNMGFTGWGGVKGALKRQGSSNDPGSRRFWGLESRRE